LGGPYGPLDRNLTSVNGVDQRTLKLTAAEKAELRSGGIQQRLFTTELLFPMGTDNIRGVVFFDMGNVTAEDRQYQLLGEKKPAFKDMYKSTGLGIRMITPMGVMRFEYGVKINPRPGETPNKFDFTISGLF